MNHSANSRRTASRKEYQQRKLDAGFVSAQYPDVAGIVISMMYQQGRSPASFPRVIYFSPESYALFKINCLTKDCVDGEFDFTQIITGMIRNRTYATKGDIRCKGSGHSIDHPTVNYEVAITYA